MVDNKKPQQYIESDWGYYFESFGATTITTSALAI
jgi:hypothetical protein